MPAPAAPVVDEVSSEVLVAAVAPPAELAVLSLVLVLVAWDEVSEVLALLPPVPPVPPVSLELTLPSLPEAVAFVAEVEASLVVVVSFVLDELVTPCIPPAPPLVASPTTWPSSLHPKANKKKTQNTL